MSLPAKNIRFDPEVWEWAAIEASHLGIATSEFIRGAVLTRCAYSKARRDPAAVDQSNELYAAADRYVSRSDPLKRGDAEPA